MLTSEITKERIIQSFDTTRINPRRSTFLRKSTGFFEGCAAGTLNAEATRLGPEGLLSRHFSGSHCSWHLSCEKLEGLSMPITAMISNGWENHYHAESSSPERGISHPDPEMRRLWRAARDAAIELGLA